MSLKDALASIPDTAKAPGFSGSQVPKRSVTAAPLSRKVKPEAAPIALQGTAKSRHPEFEAKKVFLRKATAKKAGRRYEDETGGDFSDLVQELLERYLRS